MGKGVTLNRNTYQKMSQNGDIEWTCQIDNHEYCYTGERDRIKIQLREYGTPTYYDTMVLRNDPYLDLVEYHRTHPQIPPPPSEEDFKRAWKKQVKRKFNMAGWVRK